MTAGVALPAAPVARGVGLPAAGSSLSRLLSHVSVSLPSSIVWTCVVITGVKGYCPTTNRGTALLRTGRHATVIIDCVEEYGAPHRINELCLHIHNHMCINIELGSSTFQLHSFVRQVMTSKHTAPRQKQPQGAGQGCPAAPQGPHDCKPTTLHFHVLPLV